MVAKPSASRPLMRSVVAAEAGSAKLRRAALGSSRIGAPSTRTGVSTSAAPARERTLTVLPGAFGADSTPPAIVPAEVLQVTSPAATGASRSSRPAALKARCRPGKTRASRGVIARSWTVPSPGATKTPTPLGSLRSLPSLGTLRTVASGLPSGRAIIVVEPPPSRLSAVSAPRSAISTPICARVGPSTSDWRPSVVTSSIVRPPSLKPIEVRGAWPSVPTIDSGCGTPSLTRIWRPPTANCSSSAMSLLSA